MINCIILDDEPLAIKVIENFIKKIDFLNCIGTFPNANDAMGTLKKEKVVKKRKYLYKITKVDNNSCCRKCERYALLFILIILYTYNKCKKKSYYFIVDIIHLGLFNSINIFN